jgi:aldehyde dehydrogenase (NAD+)
VDNQNKLAFNDGWQYAPAPESTDHIVVDEQYELFIDGEFVAPEEGRYFETINPATEETLSSVALATAGDVDLAVKAARKAYKGPWSKMKASERGKYIYRNARIMQERAREFAAIESLDGGKPIRESRDIDIPLAAAHFFYYAGWADKLQYAFPGRKPQSLGVAGQIIPWNFPLLMASWKIAPALACGNTVVLKPAETTPLTAMKLAEVIRDAGVPAYTCRRIESLPHRNFRSGSWFLSHSLLPIYDLARSHFPSGPAGLLQHHSLHGQSQRKKK